MSDVSLDAVIFDIDGTLIDSNYLHVDAWQHALQVLGYEVPAWRIHRGIGMGSDKLLPALIGDDAASSQSDEASLLHSAFFAAHRHRLHVLPGAQELLEAVAESGRKVVLATSASPTELEALLDVLDSDAVDIVTSADDVDKTKPDPDVLGVAMQKANVGPDRTLLVGDAIWDVRAAINAGLPCMGVESGGTCAEALRDEGAVAVYDDAQALLNDWKTDPFGKAHASQSREG